MLLEINGKVNRVIVFPEDSLLMYLETSSTKESRLSSIRFFF